jgi:hypothetical protein
LGHWPEFLLSGLQSFTAEKWIKMGTIRWELTDEGPSLAQPQVKSHCSFLRHVLHESMGSGHWLPPLSPCPQHPGEALALHCPPWMFVEWMNEQINARTERCRRKTRACEVNRGNRGNWTVYCLSSLLSWNSMRT